jgi:aerobic C4-dicarboxylate transport protein
VIAPVIFCTVVHGIASMGDLKKVGRVGVKTLFYFEVVSTLALGMARLSIVRSEVFRSLLPKPRPAN